MMKLSFLTKIDQVLEKNLKKILIEANLRLMKNSKPCEKWSFVLSPKWFCDSDMSGQSTFGFLKTFVNINHLKWMRELPFSIGKLILKLVVIKFFMSLFRCCCSCCPPQKSRGKQAMHNLWEESFCCWSQLRRLHWWREHRRD